MVVFAAQGLGYFKDEGLDSRLVQGGSGVKTREIIASGQGDFAIADFVHPMLLTNKGRPCKALTAVDRIAAGLQFMIRADLYEQGITDLAKFVAWKRPDGRKPIIGVSSIGGTTHVWSTYFMDQLGYEGAVTWLGVGNVDTMLGSLKTKQIDVLINTTTTLVGEVESQGFGKLLYDGSDPKNWDKVIGGTVPGHGQFLPAIACRARPGAGAGLDQRPGPVVPLDREAHARRDLRGDRAFRGQHVAGVQPDRDQEHEGGAERRRRHRRGSVRPRGQGLVPGDDGRAEAPARRRLRSGVRREGGREVSRLMLARVEAAPRESTVRTRVDVRGLGKTFQLGARVIEAVQDVTFTVGEGEFVSLLGPSGSGKSTVLNMIATLLPPSSGSILVDGEPVQPGRAVRQVGLRLPEGHPVPVADRGGQHRIRARTGGDGQGVPPGACRPCCCQGRAGWLRECLPVLALGRHAAKGVADADPGP